MASEYGRICNLSDELRQRCRDVLWDYYMKDMSYDASLKKHRTGMTSLRRFRKDDEGIEFEKVLSYLRKKFIDREEIDEDDQVK